MAFVALQVGILKQYQVDRLTAFTDPTERPARHRLQHPAGAHRDRLGRAVRHRAVPGPADPGPVRARRTRPTSSTRWRGRSSASSARRGIILLLGDPALARDPHRRARLGPVRPARRHRRRGLDRLPGLREHRHEPRHHAGDRRAAARSSPTAAPRMFASWIAIGLLLNVHLTHPGVTLSRPFAIKSPTARRLAPSRRRGPMRIQESRTVPRRRARDPARRRRVGRRPRRGRRPRQLRERLERRPPGRRAEGAPTTRRRRSRVLEARRHCSVGALAVRR